MKYTDEDIFSLSLMKLQAASERRAGSVLFDVDMPVLGIVKSSEAELIPEGALASVDGWIAYDGLLKKDHAMTKTTDAVIDDCSTYTNTDMLECLYVAPEVKPVPVVPPTDDSIEEEEDPRVFMSWDGTQPSSIARGASAYFKVTGPFGQTTWWNQALASSGVTLTPVSNTMCKVEASDVAHGAFKICCMDRYTLLHSNYTVDLTPIYWEEELLSEIPCGGSAGGTALNFTGTPHWSYSELEEGYEFWEFSSPGTHSAIFILTTPDHPPDEVEFTVYDSVTPVWAGEYWSKLEHTIDVVTTWEYVYQYGNYYTAQEGKQVSAASPVTSDTSYKFYVVIDTDTDESGWPIIVYTYTYTAYVDYLDGNSWVQFKEPVQVISIRNYTTSEQEWTGYRYTYSQATSGWRVLTLDEYYNYIPPYASPWTGWYGYANGITEWYGAVETGLQEVSSTYEMVYNKDADIHTQTNYLYDYCFNETYSYCFARQDWSVSGGVTTYTMKFSGVVQGKAFSRSASAVNYLSKFFLTKTPIYV